VFELHGSVVLMMDFTVGVVVSVVHYLIIHEPNLSGEGSSGCSF
jgi:hypothetical protein